MFMASARAKGAVSLRGVLVADIVCSSPLSIMGHTGVPRKWFRQDRWSRSPKRTPAPTGRRWGLAACGGLAGAELGGVGRVGGVLVAQGGLHGLHHAMLPFQAGGLGLGGGGVLGAGAGHRQQ